MKDGKKGTKPKKATEGQKADRPKNVDAAIPSEKPAWKRMGKAIGVALAINLLFLATLMVPMVGFVLFLMVGPYTGALIGGKWLNRAQKGEWLWSTFWVVIIWSSALVALIVGLLQTLGSFELVIDIYGGLLIGIIYLFPLIFTLTGFYQGSLIIEGDDEEHVEGGLGPKKEQKKKKEPEPAVVERPEVPQKDDDEPEDDDKLTARPVIRS